MDEKLINGLQIARQRAAVGFLCQLNRRDGVSTRLFAKKSSTTLMQIYNCNPRQRALDVGRRPKRKSAESLHRMKLSEETTAVFERELTYGSPRNCSVTNRKELDYRCSKFPKTKVSKAIEMHVAHGRSPAAAGNGFSLRQEDKRPHYR